MPGKKKRKKFFLRIRIYSMILIFVLVLIIVNVYLPREKNEKTLVCGDGTLDGACSLIEPYFCLNGTLIEKASVCSCPEILTIQGDLCISKYQTTPKNITLKYVLRGKENKLNFTVYKGLVDYISLLPISLFYKDEKFSRSDFELRNINEKEQRELLLPLVIKIQNIAKNKEDQVRIATSIVQEIPYGESERIVGLGKNHQINYSRYPYEVLYESEGACGGKSELLAFLLKELGYGVILFYYPSENHQALGVKCPSEYSLDNTDYCFIETTRPSIISNDQGYYSGWGKLTSRPQIISISKGDSLGENLYEYEDAKDLIKISEVIEEKGKILF